MKMKMKKIELLNNVKDYVLTNFNGSEVELYNFLYKYIEEIGETISEDTEELEEILIDRNSSCYRKLANLIIKEDSIDITIKEVGTLYYLIKNDNDEIKEIYDKIEFILNTVEENSKGYIFQEFSLLFLEENDIKIMQRKKVDDGGLDIVGYKQGDFIITGIEQRLYIYGQVKFYKGLVSTCYLKQLIKDKLYNVVKEKNAFEETETAIFISHKGFSNNAIKYAKANNIMLMDTVQIIKRILQLNKNAKCLEYINKAYRSALRKSK